jgi:hypothetical protein
MSWKTLSNLVSGRSDDREARTTRQELEKLIRTFDNRVQVPFGAAVYPGIAERLANFGNAVPSIPKRDIILTALHEILEVCEGAPDRAIEALKIGCFESRGKVNLSTKITLEMDERLNRLLKILPGVSRRQVVEAGLDLVLSRCETINGGPFPPAMPRQES